MADTALEVDSNRHEHSARNDVTSQELPVSCIAYAKIVAFLLFLGSTFYHALLHNTPGMLTSPLSSNATVDGVLEKRATYIYDVCE